MVYLRITCDKTSISIVLAEFAALKEECSNLRLRIQDIETEMKKFVRCLILCQ